RCRAWTDCDPVASQPAPDNAVSTRGARKPSATATTSHPTSTPRKWVAAYRPRRPIGPTARATSDVLSWISVFSLATAVLASPQFDGQKRSVWLTRARLATLNLGRGLHHREFSLRRRDSFLS